MCHKLIASPQTRRQKEGPHSGKVSMNNNIAWEDKNTDTSYVAIVVFCLYFLATRSCCLQYFAAISANTRRHIGHYGVKTVLKTSVATDERIKQ